MYYVILNMIGNYNTWNLYVQTSSSMPAWPIHESQSGSCLQAVTGDGNDPTDRGSNTRKKTVEQPSDTRSKLDKQSTSVTTDDDDQVLRVLRERVLQQLGHRYGRGNNGSNWTRNVVLTESVTNDAI